MEHFECTFNDLNIDANARAAAEEFIKVSKELSGDKTYWPVRMFVSLNTFLWHLDAFAKDTDPIPEFVEHIKNATAFLKATKNAGICLNLFPANATSGELSNKEFEDEVSGLFSDVWVDMSDDIYFDETYNFTKIRLEKNNVDPHAFFGNKVILDAGCGSGKFSAAIANFGAKKVIGVDLGKKGLEFAKTQAAKVPYGSKLEYVNASLLDIPLEDGSVDMVWSNGVIHHTTNYEECIAEFSRVTKPGGELFLYVNGHWGLLGLLQDTLRLADADIPRALFQKFLLQLGVNTGRLYWLMDCLYAPYEYKPKEQVVAMLEKHGYKDIQQLTRGVDIDQIELVSSGVPYAEVKYGEAQLKFIAKKAG